MYKDLIKEITFEEVKQKCKSGEININSSADEVWVVNYLGNEAENQADHLLNMFVDNEIAFMVEINPSSLYDKIYSVKDHNGNTDIIAIFKKGIIDTNKMFEIYEDTIDEFTVSKYISDQEKLNSIEKEEYDPLGFKERQSQIDIAKQKYKDGEISLGELLKELGYNIDYNKEQAIEIAEKLIKREMTYDNLKDLYKKGEITYLDLIDISSIIDKEFPELHKEFNEISQ